MTTGAAMTSVPMSWAWQRLMARIERAEAARRSEWARAAAHPSESHANARARLVAVEAEVSRRMTRAMLFGEYPA